MPKDKRRTIKLNQKTAHIIEQMYAMDTEKYGTKIEDIPDKYISDIIYKALNSKWERVMSGLQKAMELMGDL